jgi:acetyl-CoA synthetase
MTQPNDAWTGQGEPIAWRPTPEYLERSRLLRFMRQHGIESFEALLARANADPAWFWDAVSADLDLRWFTPYSQVMDTSDGIPWTRWFVGGKFNYAANALDKHVGQLGTGLMRAQPDKTALIWEGEEGTVRRLSYADLTRLTNQAANALAALGVGKGDRVGIFMPMIPETAAATLACGKLGAIFIPIFSGYGAEAVATRLRDAEAKVLVTADGFFRRGKLVGMYETADEACALAPSVARVLVARRAGRALALKSPRDAWWHDAVDGQSSDFAAVQTDAEDPYMLIYTSGTTGRPKGAVHVQSGFPIKGAQDLAHCFDMQPDDTLFWLTDIGWMMGPWAISGALLLGGTLLIYDGTPDYPGPDRLWELAEKHKVTIIGVAPTAIRSLMSHGTEPVAKHNLSSLRVIGSTGEPWNVAPWYWCFEHVGGKRLPIINYSGGTEISGGIVGCTTITPIKPCSFAGPVPGIAADVVNDLGEPVRGTVGELAIRGPWPGMTRGFWHDRARYLDTYWSRIPGLWVHGDFAAIDDDGFWYILGRSDDTIKVAGKRLGPAEAESAAVSHPAVAEAAAIGAPHAVKGETLVLFVVLRPGQTPSPALAEEIRTTVAGTLGPALKPESVFFVSQLARTRNGKILRRLMRQSYLGVPLGDLSSLENPVALEEIAASHSGTAGD